MHRMKDCKQRRSEGGQYQQQREERGLGSGVNKEVKEDQPLGVKDEEFEGGEGEGARKLNKEGKGSKQEKEYL